MPRRYSPARALGQLLSGVASACLAAPALAATLNLFACEPEWAALARNLAPRANIVSATHARQDPHDIEARPALISALRRADLALCTGASLEAGWLPMLQQRAGNPNTLPGKPGMFIAADGLNLIADAHHHPARDKGHVHREGNPHFQLDPARLAQVAARLSERLAQLDPADASGYRERFMQWQTAWAQKMQAWRQRAQPLFGKAVLAEHSSFAYLFRWLELYQVADLEPVPGLPPTLAHLQTLLQRSRDDPPMAVIQTLYQDPQAGLWIGQRLAIPVLFLPSTVTAEGPTQTLEGLFDHLIDALVGAAIQRPGQR